MKIEFCNLFVFVLAHFQTEKISLCIKQIFNKLWLFNVIQQTQKHSRNGEMDIKSVKASPPAHLECTVPLMFLRLQASSAECRIHSI